MAEKSAAELRILGQSQVTGTGTAADVTAGIANLEAAANQGDVHAKAMLGKILLDGYYVTADPARGASLLEQAIAAGDAGAGLTLGNAYLWGYRVPRDTARARALLEKSAASGETEAMRVLGEQLVSGTIWPAEARTGEALLENSLKQGNVRAGVTLGSILLYGSGLPRNRAKAVELFEQAARSGEGRGLEIYGEWLMWQATDPGGAETTLRRAASLGRASAWSLLAEGAMYGYLAPKSRAKFSEFAEKGRAAGENRIAVLEAHRQMWGISMRASGSKTVEGLEAAARKGNADAARFLISLVRDGNRLNIRRDSRKAMAYVEAFSALLTPLEAEQFRFSIDATSARSPEAYRKLAKALQQRNHLLDNWFARELTSANPNLIVYLLQSKMKESGAYRGRLNGLATPSTVSSLKAECARLVPGTACRQGVLAPAAAAAMLVP